MSHLPASNRTRALALLALAVFVAFATGVIPTPDVEKLIQDLGESLGRWSYVLVAGLAFLETGAFVGLIAPGEFSIILGGVFAGQGRIDIVVLIGLVWAAAVTGDCLSFLLGRRLGRGFLERHGPKVQITEARLQQVEGFFARHGGATILIGRFVGLVRALAPFVAGASRMSFRRFLPFDVIGAGLWSATFCLLGYVFWQSFDQVTAIAGKGAFALGALIAVVVGVVAARRWYRDEGNAERVRAWIEQRPLVQRVVGPLAFFWRRVTPGDLGLELTTLLATGLVGAFTFGGLASLVHSDASLRGDARTLSFADDIRTGVLDDTAKLATNLGELAFVGPLVLLAMAFLFSRREVLEGAALAAGLAITYAGVHITKAAEGRPRPAGSLVETTGSSFPSGHAAYAVALIAVAVAFRHAFTGWAGKSVAVVVAVVVALLVAATRVYLRAHWMTDVAGGLGLGVAAFSLSGLVALVLAFGRSAGNSASDSA